MILSLDLPILKSEKAAISEATNYNFNTASATVIGSATGICD